MYSCQGCKLQGDAKELWLLHPDYALITGVQLGGVGTYADGGAMLVRGAGNMGEYGRGGGAEGQSCHFPKYLLPVPEEPIPAHSDRNHHSRPPTSPYVFGDGVPT